MAQDNAGFLCYGPYTTLPAGVYTVKYRMMIDNNTTNVDYMVKIDVWDATANKLLAERNIRRNEFLTNNTYQNFAINFDNRGTTAGHLLEFRVWWYDQAYVKIDRIEVWPSLVTGSNVTVSVPWVYPGGTHNVCVRVDPDNTVYELNETNNVATKLLMPKIITTAVPSSLTADGIAVATITATVVDENNNVVTSAAGNITVTISGQGTWQDGSVGASLLALNGGVVVIRAKSTLVPGSFRVDATGTGLITSSVTVVTGAGQPTKLLASAVPTNITATGLSISTITVSLVDAGNNIVQIATNTVTFSISGQGTWADASVGATLVAPSNGVATISVRSLTQTGQITVNSIAPGLAGAVINITVQPGQPYKLWSVAE
jgi:hypothetical protein